jgi:glucosamine-6-phosphate deaminase
MMTADAAPIPLVDCTPAEGARAVAAEISALIRTRRAAGRGVVLGLATGRTPLEIYAELVRLHREEGLDFANVTTFNLDEYLGLRADHPQSYRRYMRERVWRPLGMSLEQGWIPASELAPSQVDAHCREYERAIAEAGGIDLQLLGIGRNGHIGFNEPGSPRDSRTRHVELHAVTREDAARDFGSLDAVPRHAITMGVATILSARRIRVLAFGPSKREVLERALAHPVGPEIPATFLRGHPDLRLYTDLAPARGGDSR